jgi:hypothetical protein
MYDVSLHHKVTLVLNWGGFSHIMLLAVVDISSLRIFSFAVNREYYRKMVEFFTQKASIKISPFLNCYFHQLHTCSKRSVVKVFYFSEWLPLWECKVCIDPVVRGLLWENYLWKGDNFWRNNPLPSVISLQLCELNHIYIIRSYLLIAAWYMKYANQSYDNHKASKTWFPNEFDICWVNTALVAYNSLFQRKFHEHSCWWGLIILKYPVSMISAHRSYLWSSGLAKYLLSAKYENFRISWKWFLENVMNPIILQGVFRKFPHFYIFEENRTGGGGGYCSVSCD